MATPDALLVDIDGVLVLSWKPLPGAREAIDALRSAGVPMRFLTNTTSRTRAAITDTLRRVGFDVAADEVLTVAAATSDHLRKLHPGARCLLLNHGDGMTDLEDVTLADPADDPRDVDVVLLGGAGPEFTYAALNHALACLVEGAALVALHRNPMWRTEAGLQLDTGAYVIGLERAAGVAATVIGKPAPAMFLAALATLGMAPGQAAMVGDDLDSDVRAAQALGITGVLVRTGKFRAAQMDGNDPPDVVLDSFADVPRWLGIADR